ncbi:MAG: hypothetical protein BXU00_03340 [Candidatus Nanoclepta minutus]|uniref:Uncharacterized protein n=1 Tax=Candidatus Nanoclepta minutus TaxID=1940235 RepID=A0A397WMF9_9ARCH|nr:MAG: hypothetical protein BXU00_03340 [Candidatus Nanoclepta minutus]
MSEITIRESFISYLEQYGFFSFILPFLLIFSLIFLLLEVTNVFKRNENDIIGRRINIAFSFGFALTAISNIDMVKWLVYLIPNASIWILGIFLFILALGIATSKIEMPRWLRGAISLIVIGAITVIAANAVVGGTEGISMGPIDYSILSTAATILIIFAIIIAVIAWVTSEPKEKGQQTSGSYGP